MERSMDSHRFMLHLMAGILLLVLVVGVEADDYDYGKALDLSLQFFEAQRSGPLPANQRVTWRGDSGLSDGQAEGVDLVGGYYDAGDNVKFQFPMAFTVTMLSWSVIEYESHFEQQGQLSHAFAAIKWGTDYFIKAHPEPNVLWAQVGDGTNDHDCWQRPEDMTTSRQAYKIDANNPGSDVAGETAAAMAAASIVFQSTDLDYSATLLAHAKQLFTFADTYRGDYDNSIPVVKPFYASGQSGFKDELLWAALWLFEATGDDYYLHYACENAQSLGGTSTPMDEFSWDAKFAGAQVLASKILLEGRGGEHTSTLEAYQDDASFFMCAALDKNSQEDILETAGGLFYTLYWDNMQAVTSAAFLVTVHGDHLTQASQPLSCAGSSLDPAQLLNIGRAQVDYILGNNPRKTSYMVGFGNTFPEFVHHRGASIASIKSNPAFVGCKEGFTDWYNNAQANPNTLVGALVGGPDQSDIYWDSRSNYIGNEATTYNSAPLVGLLARFCT